MNPAIRIKVNHKSFQFAPAQRYCVAHVALLRYAPCALCRNKFVRLAKKEKPPDLSGSFSH